MARWRHEDGQVVGWWSRAGRGGQPVRCRQSVVAQTSPSNNTRTMVGPLLPLLLAAATAATAQVPPVSRVTCHVSRVTPRAAAGPVLAVPVRVLQPAAGQDHDAGHRPRQPPGVPGTVEHSSGRRINFPQSRSSFVFITIIIKCIKSIELF